MFSTASMSSTVVFVSHTGHVTLFFGFWNLPAMTTIPTSNCPCMVMESQLALKGPNLGVVVIARRPIK